MTLYTLVLTTACAALVLTGDPSSYHPDWMFWVPVIAAANMAEVSLTRQLQTDMTLGPIAVVATALTYEPAAVVVFAFVGALHRRELRRQAPIVMAVFNRSMMALSGAVAAFAATAVEAWIGDQAWAIVPMAVLASLCFDATNHTLLAIMLVVRRGQTWRDAFRHAANPFPRAALNVSVSTMLSLLIFVLVEDVSRWAVLLIAIPLWLSQSAQRSAREAQDRAEELAARVRELEMLNRLSTDLLSVRTSDEAERVARAVLEATGDFGEVVLDTTDAGERPSRSQVPIIGAEPAAIVVAEEVDGPTRAGLEAAASLIGLTWTRLGLEAELAETERARTALTEQILEEGTRERSRIAMSVHDDVLPLFAAAQMQIDTADMFVEMNDLERAGETIERATAGVNEGIRALRDTLEDLRQSTLVPGTVADGVRKLLADLQARTGIRGTVDAPSPMPDLPFAVELLAYETIRGCLANVEKHSQATKVQVELCPGEGTLVILMHDDGRGFDATRVGTRSHGLALMRQRAELARGGFEISGAPGAGTTVRLEVPTW